jgi:hypothetical protein
LEKVTDLEKVDVTFSPATFSPAFADDQRIAPQLVLEKLEGCRERHDLQIGIGRIVGEQLMLQRLAF